MVIEEEPEPTIFDMFIPPVIIPPTPEPNTQVEEVIDPYKNFYGYKYAYEAWGWEDLIVNPLYLCFSLLYAASGLEFL